MPGTRLSMPFVGERDRADIEFGIKVGFDYIAASFTRSAGYFRGPEDLGRAPLPPHEYIAKIENAEGVNNIDEIIRVTDGIMVARGDMGVEIPLEEVPVLQKKIIKRHTLPVSRS